MRQRSETLPIMRRDNNRFVSKFDSLLPIRSVQFQDDIDNENNFQSQQTHLNKKKRNSEHRSLRKASSMSGSPKKQASSKKHLSQSISPRRKRKRTKSELNESGDLHRAHLKSNLSHFDSLREPIKDTTVFGNAPAKELVGVIWDGFIEQSLKRNGTHNIIRELYQYPLLEQIIVLRLENHGLERIFQYLRPCQNLVALYLKHNRVMTRDLVQIKHLVKLRSVDLSSNEITFLPDVEYLQDLKQIEYLQLHNNLLISRLQLKNLTCFPVLHHLTLQGNPCSKLKEYRQLMVDSMPQLQSLDEFIVMDFERKDIKQMFPPENLKKDKLRELNRFRPFNEEHTSWRSTAFVIAGKEMMSQNNSQHRAKAEIKDSHSSSDEETYYRHRLSSTLITENFSLTTESEGIQQHLKAEAYQLRRKFEYCSPIIMIQSRAKKFVYRKRYLRKRVMTRLLVWALNRWHLRQWMERMMRGEHLTRDLLFQIGRLRFIQKTFKKFLRKWRVQLRFALKGQSIKRMKEVQNMTFARALGLNLSRTSSKPAKKLLFIKSQFELMSRLGFMLDVLSFKDNEQYTLRSDKEVCQVSMRRSPLMNILISSYRFARIQRSKSVFQQALKIAIAGQKQIVLQKRVIEPSLVVAEVDSPREDTVTNFLPSKKYNLQSKAESKKTSVEDLLPKPVKQSDSVTLIEVTYKDDFDVARAIEEISHFNRRHHFVVQIFYEPYLRRFQSTLILQRWYKGILFKRRTKPIFVERADGTLVLGDSIAGRPINLDNTLYQHFALIQRVARRVQRVWRKRCLCMRISALANIANYVAQINSKKLFIDQTVYQNLEKIYSTSSSPAWFKPTDNSQKSSRSPSKPGSSNSPKRRYLHKKQGAMGGQPVAKVKGYADYTEALYERRAKFEVSAKDHKVRISYNAIVDKVGRYSESKLPLWFQRKSDTEIPRIGQRKGRQPTFANHILSLIHMQSHLPGIKDAPRVIYLSELQNVTLSVEMRDLKLVRINFDSVKEAKNRAIMIALLTINMRKSSTNFVRMFTKSNFQGILNSNKSYQLILKYQKVNRLADNDTKSYLAPSYLTLGQTHNGVIKKREEPYKTMLRARPKEKKTQFERFIVLGDADPKHVEERIGNALLSQEIVQQLGTGSDQQTTPLEYSRLEPENLPFDQQYSYKGHIMDKNEKRGYARKPTKGGWTNRAASQNKLQIRHLNRHDLDKRANSGTKGGQLSHADIATQKQRLIQNRDKIYKIETLQRKLRQLKDKIENRTQMDPDFKLIFVRVLMPMIQERSKQIEVMPQPQQPEQKEQNYLGYSIDGDQLQKKHQDTDQSKNPTTVYERPKTNVNYSDPRAGITEEMIEKQIQSLFDEFKIQKQAYRLAVNKCQVELTRNVNIITSSNSNSKSNSARMTRQVSVAGDWPMRINAKQARSPMPIDIVDISILPKRRLKPKLQRKVSSPLISSAETKSKEERQNMIVKNENIYTIKTKEVASLPRQATQNSHAFAKNSFAFATPKRTSANINFNNRVNQAGLSPRGGAAEQSTLVLNRFTELLQPEYNGSQAVAEVQPNKNIRPIVVSKSTSNIRGMALPLLQQQQKEKQSKKVVKLRQHDREFTNGFVNQTNKINAIASSSQRNAKRIVQQIDLKNIVQSTKLTRGISQMRMQKIDQSSPRLDTIAIDQVANNNSTVAAEVYRKDDSFRANLLHKNFSPRLNRKPTILRDASSIIKRDPNVQGLSVEAKRIESDQVDERGGGQFSARKLHLNLSNQDMSHHYNQFQPDESLTHKQKNITLKIKDAKPFNLNQESRNTESHHQLQDIISLAKNQPLTSYTIPSIRKITRKSQINNTLKRTAMNESRATILQQSDEMLNKDLPHRQSMDNTSLIAQMKTEEILTDIEDMQKAREIAQLQLSQQQSDRNHYRRINQSSGLRASVNAQERTNLVNVSFQRNPRIERILEHKKKKMQLAKLVSRTVAQVPKKLQAASQNNRNSTGNLSTIETIMRTRNMHQQNKDSIISQSGVYNLEDVQPYLNPSGSAEQLLNIGSPPQDIQKVLAVDHIDQQMKESSSGFSYMKHDLIEPKQSLVGVSRTKSVNKFTARDRNRKVLTFLPPLTKQSIGKFTQIQ